MTLLSILGIGGRAAKHMPTVLTGARVTLEAQHRDRISGNVHGHTWIITAWVSAGGNAHYLQAELSKWSCQYDGKCLPDRIAWGEDMATDVAQHLSGEHWEPVRVNISREKEGLFAEWTNPPERGEGEKS